jgi:hypothetical protein
MMFLAPPFLVIFFMQRSVAATGEEGEQKQK